MPDFELHADYDRNGAVSAGAAEYDQRARAPGAILVPNLDADARALPASASKAKPVVRDVEQLTRLAVDDEQLALRIRTVRASAPPKSQFFLHITGRAALHIEVHDDKGRHLQHAGGQQGDIPFTPPDAGKDLKLTLEMKELLGTPIGILGSRAVPVLEKPTFLGAFYTPDGADDAPLTIELRSRAPDGQETVHDTARVTVAPAIMLDSSAPAVRIYIVVVWGNQASVQELEEALAGTGVKVVQVDGDLTGGDSWLQDQYQHAVMQGADGYRQVLIHLPRLRNTNQIDGKLNENLERFVNSHFPSRNLGVFTSLWQRQFPVRQVGDIRDAEVKISFRASEPLARLMLRVWAINNYLTHHIRDVSKKEPTVTVGNLWTTAYRTLRPLLDELRRLPKASAFAKAAEQQIDEVQKLLTSDADVFKLPVGDGGKTLTVSADVADQLFARLAVAHSSHNYGGNLESSPPLDGARLGKLVVGNQRFEVPRQQVANDFIVMTDLIDPDVMRILDKQDKQPIVQLDTGWLDVGHVDEVMGFSPDARQATPGFAVLHASSLLALRLLELARDRYVAGLPAGHAHASDRKLWTSERLTIDGKSPVTRLFRGKLWLHVQQAGEDGRLGRMLEPPRIYQAMANLGFLHEITFEPGPGPRRSYLADATVRELVVCERAFGGDLESATGPSTNRTIEALFCKPIADKLRKEFPGARRFPLPVLFDRVVGVGGWATDSRDRNTSAFTPDLVNFQAINGRLLIPRPYGPRMRLDDVRAVLDVAMRERGLPARMLARLTPAFVKSRALTKGIYWLELQPPLKPYQTYPLRHLITLDAVASEFRDSFPDLPANEARERITKANPALFRGAPPDDGEPFKLVIDDGMLDIFQTYTELVAAELDVPVFWIDAWYYHVRLGGIHCGTNVLRVPKPGIAPQGVGRPAQATAGDARPRDLVGDEGLPLTGRPSAGVPVA